MKKIILIVTSFLLFTGVATASSLNGDYKGNPIVIVKSNGVPLQSDEVPAMIIDGHTMVPISLLRQIGVNVNWNANNYSVDVTLPQQQTQPTLSMSQISNLAKSHNVLMITNSISPLSNDGSILTFFHSGLFQNNTISSNDFSYMLYLCSQTDAYRCRISDAQQKALDIDNVYVKDFFNKAITLDQLKANYHFEGNQQIPNSANQSSINSNIQSSNQQANATAIESQIDGDFNGYDTDNVYKLTNGQIWKQTSADYEYHYSYMPNVVIYQDGLIYKMKVDDMDDTITVERLK